MASLERTPVVVVGADGSTESAAAVAWAERYAQTTGASLRVVVAYMWPMSYGYPMRFEGFDPRRDAERVAEKVSAGLTLPSDRVSTHVVDGHAGEVLVADSADADLLVVGARGQSIIQRLTLGSISTYCVHHATVPVVVVR
jgi:nucleotide-binding universal stress UspA family protein